MKAAAIRAQGRWLATGMGMLLAVMANAAEASSTTAAADADARFLTGANNALALKLYQRLAPAADGNVFFSPYSISTALTMTWLGARGDTAAQMAQVLGYEGRPAAQVTTAEGQWQKKLNELQAKSGPRVLAANSLWPQQGHPILPDYLRMVQSDFFAEIMSLDYQNPTAATQRINTWVEEKTEKRVKDLLHPGDVPPDTRLILVNAIYFKGNWAEKFAAAQTAAAPFTVKGGEPKKVELMHRKMDAARLADISDGPVPLQILALPYQGGALEFVALLPKSPGDLSTLEKNLAVTALDGWLAKLSDPREVEVFLPKFKLNERYGLVPPLRALGITDAFTTQADFSGMDGARDLYIGGVVHQAFIEVNEEGTEAAAATGVVMRALAVQVTPTFRADHPFLFFIRDTATGGILFIGRLTAP